MIVIKIGGGKSIHIDNICKDIHKFIQQQEQIIIVHGASVKRDEIAEQLGIKTHTVTSPSGISSVYTDTQAMEVFLMAYAGVVNKQIVASMISYSINAVGLSGVDGKLWVAKRKKELYIKEGNKTKLLKDNYTGRVEKINTHLITTLLNNGYIPVISAPAISYENEIVNTDNDWATAVMAGSLKADKLIYLFEEQGLLQDFNDKSSIIPHIKAQDMDTFLEVAQGRMKKKILGVKEALKLGVKQIYFGDGRIKNPVINALQGKGTTIS